MTKTVLVAGGTGFVASWCIAGLLKRGYNVRTTVRNLSRAAGVKTAVGSSGAPVEKLSFFATDLTADAGWDTAMAGCEYVLHVASPLGYDAPRDRNALVVPARDGTVRVLRAAARAGVKRVVMTAAATCARPRRRDNAVSDESVWAEPSDPRFDAYRLSKILAEQAAWALVAKEWNSIQLTTILPGAVFGPVLSKENLGSVQIVQRLLIGNPALVPRIGLWLVDVRDLADLHIRAMLAPEAAGQRFLAVGEFLWMSDIAKVLRDKLGSAAKKVPTRHMPDALFRFLALFVPVMRTFTAELGRKTITSSEKAKRLLGFSPRASTVTIVDCAQSLLAAR